MAHYVYAIAMEGDAPLLETALKIGIAANPSARLSNMQTGSPYKMAIRKTWHFKSEAEARDFEQACHAEFKPQNIMREWFTISIAHIERFYDSFFTVKDVDKEAAELLHALSNKKGINTRGLAATPQRASQVPMSTAAAAEYIGVSSSWLNKSRMTGTGPAYLKIGGKVRYAQQDLENWLAESRRTAVYDHAQRAA